MDDPHHHHHHYPTLLCTAFTASSSPKLTQSPEREAVRGQTLGYIYTVFGAVSALTRIVYSNDKWKTIS